MCDPFSLKEVSVDVITFETVAHDKRANNMQLNLISKSSLYLEKMIKFWGVDEGQSSGGLY